MAGPDITADGERIVLRMRQHPKALTWPVIVLLLCAAAGISVAAMLPSGGGFLATLRLVIGLAAVVAAAAWSGVPYLRWRMMTYELTTRRMRLREGVLARSGRDFPLTRISDVSFSQGPLDRMFGCGRLIIESAGENGRLVFREIPDVRAVQSTLFDLVNREISRTAGGDTGGY